MNEKYLKGWEWESDHANECQYTLNSNEKDIIRHWLLSISIDVA